VSPLLRTRDLVLGRAEHPLVEGLDLDIQAGECWVVMGPNGSGKTTLLKTLAGLIQPDQGRIELAGGTIERLSARDRARRLGLVFQHGRPGLHNSALELVLTGGYASRAHWWDSPEEITQARQALRAVGLEALAEQDSNTLSGGELRRAEIARLLLQAPSLAMLDEPFNHLDIGQQVATLRLLKQHFTRNGKALLLVVHDPNLARQAASHCLLLFGDGRWRAGPVGQILTREALSDLFEYPLQEIKGSDSAYWGVRWE
jgi:iron complex transport system ATP-binding protein